MDATAVSISGAFAFFASNSNEVTWQSCRMPLPQARLTRMQARVGLNLPAHSRSNMAYFGSAMSDTQCTPV